MRISRWLRTFVPDNTTTGLSLYLQDKFLLIFLTENNSTFMTVSSDLLPEFSDGGCVVDDGLVAERHHGRIQHRNSILMRV